MVVFLGVANCFVYFYSFNIIIFFIYARSTKNLKKDSTLDRVMYCKITNIES